MGPSTPVLEEINLEETNRCWMVLPGYQEFGGHEHGESLTPRVLKLEKICSRAVIERPIIGVGDQFLHTIDIPG